MSEFVWMLHDESGTDLRSSESFASKEEAESWMGSAWSDLRSEGADSASQATRLTSVWRRPSWGLRALEVD